MGRMCRIVSLLGLIAFLDFIHSGLGLIPLIDGGKGMPKLYDGWFNEQIAKQSSTAVSKALKAGKKKVEVNFPPVPNLEEVKFGTALNQKFGKNLLARDLKVTTGYKPGSDISRNLVAYANIYWAKKLASVAKGGRSVAAITAERVNFKQIKGLGDISRCSMGINQQGTKGGNEAIICINPGGEEVWDRIYNANCDPGCPMIVLNNSYSTTYDLGNKKGYEEAYYLKRISKGWVFRAFPGPWEAYLERPDGSVELMKTFKTKPALRDVSTLVREESFKRYAVFNDRWSSGFGGRL